MTIIEQLYDQTSLTSRGKKIPYEQFVRCVDKYRRSSYEQMETELKTRKSGEFDDATRKRYGCIYTPEFVIDKTLDLAWKYHPGDKLSLTYIDPACGDGNFLVALWKRLMLEDSEMEPIAKSHHILTHCLYGVEILDKMAFATKIRLVKLHCELVKKLGQTCDSMAMFNSLNIQHGNTILTPEDNFEREPREGGMLSEVERNRKYDVIVGNPPYTHLRNLANRRYAAYPNQRDMAQVFIRWALDHLKEEGVVAYNVIYTWLNKITDGANEVRALLYRRLYELLCTKEIETYSQEADGEVPTCICTFGLREQQHFNFNDEQKEHNNAFLRAGFYLTLTQSDMAFSNTSVETYIPKLSVQKTGRNFRSPDTIFNTAMFFDDSPGAY